MLCGLSLAQSGGVMLPGSPSIFMEICAPARAAGRPPVVVLGHGGLGGPTATMRQYCRRWAAQGYLVGLPHLRGQGQSAGEPSFCLHEGSDMRRAAQELFLRGGSPERVYIGFSLGGCAALAAARLDPLARGVGFVIGPTDFAEQIEILRQAGRQDSIDRWQQLMGGSPQSCPECYLQRSPLTWSREVRAPILSLQAGNDPLIPPTQTCRLAQARQDAGFAVVRVALDERAQPWQQPLVKLRTCYQPLDAAVVWAADSFVLFPNLGHTVIPAMLNLLDQALEAWLPVR
jgi:dienelactone hydrolase